MLKGQYLWHVGRLCQKRETRIPKYLGLAALLFVSVIGYVVFGPSETQWPVITEDAVNGRITFENENVKLVWHYKALASESYNQGGGNLYEHYYKPLDPEMTRNLVSFVSSSGWGNGRSTSIWAGIGGVGNTTLYATDSPPSPSDTNSFADIISDNNLSGLLESHSSQVNAEGNAELRFTYRVRNQSTGKEWYRAIKTWTVKQDGSIHLNVDWTVLESGYFSEIAIRSDWSYFAGWNRFSKYGKDWWPQGSPSYLLGAYGIDTKTAECWDSLNTFHPDWVSFTGSEVAPTLVMSADNNGQGFAGSGSYQLGTELFGSIANPTMEQCSMRPNQSVGAHGMAWMAWWGGNPPKGDRYKWVDAGTQWSDSYKINLVEGPAASPDISGIVSEELGDRIRIAWHTDTAADSQVQVNNSDNPWAWTAISSSSEKVTDHELVLLDLPPDQVYRYRVRSVDDAGQVAVSGNYFFNTPKSGEVPQPPIIDGIDSEPSNDGAAISWTTDIESNSEVQVMDAEGSVVATARDAALVRNHRLPVAGLQQGTTYFFKIISTDASNNASESTGHSFTTINGPAFDLVISLDNAYWSTFADFKDRRLSVVFSIVNKGPAMARTVTITSAVASRHAYAIDEFPVTLGDLDAGGATTFTLLFYVPNGINKFETWLYGFAVTPTGIRVDSGQ